MWRQFKSAFKAAHLDLCLATTTDSAGFQGQTHNSECINEPNTEDASPDHDNQAITQAYLSNLAEATMANHDLRL